MRENVYRKTFKGKVTEKQLDDFANEIFELIPNIIREKKSVRLNLADIEWVGNQELLFITGLLRYFAESRIPFYVQFLHEEQKPEAISFKKAVQLIQIWDVWKIGQVISGVNYFDYFDIDGRYTDLLRMMYNISTDKQEIYNRHGVTPFVILEKIDNPDDQKISEKLSRVYQLGSATKELLAYHNCSMPFDNQTLSAIVTKELYENFLDHFSKGIFQSRNDFSFLSVSLVAKIEEKGKTEQEVQSLLAKNFSEEQFLESKSFFYDALSRKYRNRSLLQLSFLDFGTGITDTLAAQYKEKVLKNGNVGPRMLESKILKYAFRHDSSKDPIDVKYLDKSTVPRGLFDLLIIVKRFGGMLIARSGKGRILFDFSTEDPVSNNGVYFGEPSLTFPGTMITIYLPEREKSQPISQMAISPHDNIDKANFDRKNIKYISLFDIQSEIKRDSLTKHDFYNEVFRKVIKALDETGKDTLYYVDFSGYDIDSRVTKKLIYFLVTDYRVNLSNSVIVVNPPPIELLESIHYEMARLSETIKQFNIHPVPFIFTADDDVSIFWMGVFRKEDIKLLNQLLYEMSDLRRSYFEEPDAVAGNVNYYDEYGNLRSLIDKGNILHNVRQSRRALQDRQVKDLILPCIKQENNAIYLCSGNYYQYEYLQLFNILSDKNSCRILTTILAERLQGAIGSLKKFYFLYNSTSSKRIVDVLINLDLIHSEKVVHVGDNLSGVVAQIRKAKVPKHSEFIIACDILSTGFVPYKLGGYLEKLNMSVRQVAVFVNSMDPNFDQKENRFMEFHKGNIVSLLDYPIKKYHRKQIVDELLSHRLTLRRINPYVNTPIIQKYKDNIGEGITLISHRDFLGMIEERHVKAGYFRFNNLIHPYFFDMDTLLKEQSRSNTILDRLFLEMDPNHIQDISYIFYPRNSGIEKIDFDHLREKILFNQSVEVVELQRFSTSEGWRFTHMPEHLYELAKGKKALILDDGSCSGESIIQMIDEVSSLKVLSIVILSVIGRINDHKRDFFSRLLDVNGMPGTIPIAVYFGSHWHVPTYYTQESPVIAEQQWLDEVAQITNLPPSIGLTIEKVRDELRLKEVTEENNQYLVTRKNGKSIIRDLLLAKELIGKITSYRLYQEHFEYFDNLVLEFDRDQQPDLNLRNFEIIASAILHEPNLYERLKEVVPDFIEKLEAFVLSVFLDVPLGDKGRIISKGQLFYKWTNKNLLHLLFITFKEAAFLRRFKHHQIVFILHRFCNEESDLNYFLYRLMKFFPQRAPSQNAHLYTGHMKMTLDAVLENHTLNGGFIKPLKRFRSFLGTLPDASQSFQTAISTLKSNYSKLVDDENHDTSLNVKYDALATQLEVLESKYDDKLIPTVVQEWEGISLFFEQLLSFSHSFPQYFGPCTEKVYGRLETYSDSLRVAHGRISEQMYAIHAGTNFRSMVKGLQKIMEGFVFSDSVYFQIFNRITTPDFDGSFKSFLRALEEKYGEMNLVISGDNLDGVAVALPEYYVRHILFDEILRNFRHCDTDQKVSFVWTRTEAKLKLVITNVPSNGGVSSGGGSGLNRLVAFNSMPDRPMHYEQTSNDPVQFVQKITFKII